MWPSTSPVVRDHDGDIKAALGLAADGLVRVVRGGDRPGDEQTQPDAVAGTGPGFQAGDHPDPGPGPDRDGRTDPGAGPVPGRASAVRVPARRCRAAPEQGARGVGTAGAPPQPDPVTAPVVTWMFGQRLAGHSAARITRALNDAGVPCPSAADP